MLKSILMTRVVAEAPEALRRPYQLTGILGLLALLLAGVMLVFNAVSPASDATGSLARFSITATTALFTLVAASNIAFRLGAITLARFGLFGYLCCLVAAMSLIAGPFVAADLLGAIVLTFAPAILFADHERAKQAICWAIAAASVIGVQATMDLVPEGFRLTDADQAETRLATLIVCIGIGAFIVYLHRSAEAAKRGLAAEKRRSDGLLLNILPERIAERLKAGQGRIADRLDAVTVVFVDIVGFTAFASSRGATEVVGLLDTLFSRFDDKVVEHGVEKIKTLGDGYIAVGGVPGGNPDHAAAAANFALDLLQLVEDFRRETGTAFRVRVGIHTGPVIAGVIGKHKFAYDMWGDTMNVASRMESSSEPDQITVSAATHDALASRYRFAARGALSVKGKGEMEAYFLLGRA